jgi:hypothetical protein
MTVELGLVGGKDLELTLLQLLLPVRHCPLSLGYGDLLCVGIRLLLDGGNGVGLSYGIQLLGVIEQLLRLCVDLLNGSLLPIDQLLLHA